MRSQNKIDPYFSLYYITSTIIDWTPILINESLVRIIIDSFKFCQNEKNLYIYGYVIMPNHFHAIISMDKPEEIPFTIRDLKRHTSQKITEYVEDLCNKYEISWLKPFYGKKINKVWQDGYHPVLIKSEKWFSQKLNYIHDNPVRKGYVERPEFWKYSSARNYILDDDSIIRLDIDKL